MGAFVGCGSLGLIAVFTDETKFHILFSYKHVKIEHQSFLVVITCVRRYDLILIN